jgi:hypothetical protein
MAISDTGARQSAAYHRNLSVTATVTGLAALAAALHVFTPFNHDEAWFIEGAGRLIDGGRFGVDIIDINPPHVWWISAVPVWLARQIGVRADIAATIFTALMAAVSLLTCDRLIEANSPAGLTRRAVVPIAAILVLFLPGHDFGQREHWALLLTLPYVVARSRRITGTTISNTAGFVVGLAACLGFCIKPTFLLVPICLEIWLLARTRRAFVWVSPETIAMVVTGFVYFGFIVIYEPTYLKRDVPNLLLGYWANQSPLPEVMFWAIIWLAPAGALALLGYLTHPQGERTSALAQAFAVAGTAYLVAALAQIGTASYHFLPSVVFFALSALVLLIAGMPQRRAAIAVLIVMGFLPSAAEAVKPFLSGGPTALINQLAAVFRANPGPNRTVTGFITVPVDVFPAVVASEMKWAEPFCCAYLIAAAVRVDEARTADRPAIWAAGLDQAETAIATVRTKKPGVIVIDANDHMMGFENRKFNYVEWLEAHTDFASVLADYREINPIAHYRIFVRK